MGRRCTAWGLTVRPGASRRAGWVVALVSLGSAIAAPVKADSKPTVVASIYPLSAIAQEIVEPGSRIVTLLTPGANPHTFEPTPSQVWAAAGASLVVRIGLGFDDWVMPVIESTGREPAIIVASHGVDLLPLDESDHEHAQHGHGETVWDPHLWLDPRVAAQIGGSIGAALVEIDPGRAAAYRRRADAFEERMRRVDAELTSVLGPHAGTPFVATHAGWAYFARRYGLRQIAVLERFPGRAAGPRYLLAVAKKARSTGAKAVFAEVQLGQGEARIIAEEAQIPVVVLDPLGGRGLEGRDTYEGLLRWNARLIASAFERPGGQARRPRG